MKSKVNTKSIKQTTGIQNIDQNSYLSQQLGLPPLPEQRAIADFLDHQTAKIDALIKKQERLIELLGEKRNALIARAVTKGLNPDVPMKESGVEWLGQIPEHWNLLKLKFLAEVNLSNIDKKSVEDETPVLLCNYIDVYNNDFVKSDIDFMKATARKDQIRKLSLKAGDILITKDSETSDDIAVPAYVPATLPGVVSGYHLALIRPMPGMMDGLFLFYCLKSSRFNYQFVISANGMTRFGIGKSAIQNAIFVEIPLHEQSAISTFLNEQSNYIVALIAKIQCSIKNMQEYRSSLISAAVTGKIDVRHGQEKEFAGLE